MHLKTLVKPLKVNEKVVYIPKLHSYPIPGTGKSRIHRITTSIPPSDAFALFNLFQQQSLLQASEDHHHYEGNLQSHH